MSLSEVARGVRFLVYYVGGAALINRRVLRAYERGGHEAGRAEMRDSADHALRIAGAETIVTGEENIPAGGCVLIYNESSLVDLVLLHRFIFAHGDAGVGAEIFNIVPWMKEASEKMRVVIFKRGDREAADRMLAKVTTWVSEGTHLVMGGEGRLTRDGSVGHFKRGGCLVAIRAGAPVVPVALTGGPEMMKVGSLRMRPGPLAVTFGKPMSTEGLTDDDAPAFAQRVRAEVITLREKAREATKRAANPGT